MHKAGFIFPLTYEDFIKLRSTNPRFWWSKEDFWAEQLWDSDCNNCRYIERIPFDRITEQPHIYGAPALCSKYDKKVRTQAIGLFSGFTCFVHIRTGESSPHNNTSNEQTKFYP